MISRKSKLLANIHRLQIFEKYLLNLFLALPSSFYNSNWFLCVPYMLARPMTVFVQESSQESRNI